METSQAPDQERGISSGPKMLYWVKRIDEKKIQLWAAISRRDQPGGLSDGLSLEKRSEKPEGKMQRRCLRQKTNKKRSNFNLYLGSHRIAALSLFTSAFSENTDVSTTELNRKPRLQFSCQWTKHSLHGHKWKLAFIFLHIRDIAAAKVALQ